MHLSAGSLLDPGSRSGCHRHSPGMTGVRLDASSPLPEGEVASLALARRAGEGLRRREGSSPHPEAHCIRFRPLPLGEVMVASLNGLAASPPDVTGSDPLGLTPCLTWCRGCQTLIACLPPAGRVRHPCERVLAARGVAARGFARNEGARAPKRCDPVRTRGSLAAPAPATAVPRVRSHRQRAHRSGSRSFGKASRVQDLERLRAK